MATAEAERNAGCPQYGGFFFARCSFSASHAFADQGVGDGTADAISRTGYQGCLARGVEWSVRQAHVDRSSDCDNCNVLRSSMSSTVTRFAIAVTRHPGLHYAPSRLPIRRNYTECSSRTSTRIFSL